MCLLILQDQRDDFVKNNLLEKVLAGQIVMNPLFKSTLYIMKAMKQIFLREESNTG